jgi:hypothetical protein
MPMFVKQQQRRFAGKQQYCMKIADSILFGIMEKCIIPYSTGLSGIQPLTLYVLESILKNPKI